MVIVLSHTVVASILYYRNPQKFQCGGSSNLNKSDAGGESASYEDITTKLAQVQNFRDLHSVVPDAIESLSSQSVCCIVFLQDVVQEELFADKENKVRFPKHGLCCATKQTQRTQRREEISPNDPLTALLKKCNKSDPSWKPKNVVCQPVVLTEDKAIIAVIVACHKSGNEVDRKILSFIEKQILACYRRMCKCNGSAVEYTVGDHESSSTGGGSPQSDIKEAIIKLCGELYDQDATILQLKVLKFLEEQTKAEYAFLLLVAPETQELFCQVVGDKVLDVEVRFPGQSSGFVVALETKEPIQLQDIPLDKRKELEEELGIKPLQSFLCVPVTSRNSNNLIALACVVNKKNNEKFTNSDVYSIRQCFQYTATVLTSTLAFQNERKLKIQTQAMLQVARNLFQHLGEFSKEHGECPIDHPSIKSGYFMVDVVGHTYADYLLLGKQGPFSHCRPCGDFDPQKDDNYYKELNHNVFINGQMVSPQLLNGEKELSEQNNTGSTRANKSKKQPCSDDGSSVTPNLSHNNYSPDKVVTDVTSSPESNTEKDLGEKLKELDKFARENYRSEAAENYIKYLDRPFLTPISDETSYETPASFVTANDSVSDVSTITDSNTGSDDPFSSGEYEKVSYGNRSSSYTRLNSSIDVILERENFENYCKTSISKSASYLPDYRKSENYTESKPELNYAFIKQYEKRYADKKSESDSSAEFLSSDHERSASSDTDYCCDMPSVIQVNPMVVVGDTESHHQHVMSSHHIITSTPNVSSLSSIQNVDKYNSTLENLAYYNMQVPCTEAVTFQVQNDLTKLLREIMQEARNLTQAERCSVFLIDTETEELVAKVFDGITTDSSEVQTEIRMPITQGIAGHVATTGELLNIKDAYSHPLFYRGIDDSTGFRTRNILCFPIKDEKGVVMGVSQLCNKKTAQCFTQFDEDVASAFAVYCCISISHCLMYKKLQDSQHRNRLANELMIYHMQVSPEDVQMLIQSDIPPSEFWSSYFDKFNYPPREISDNDTALACFSMFEDLGFISRWRIKKDTLARFVMMVKKGYRSPPYHNWMHAFAVAHFCYLCIKNCNLTQCLEDIELFALFVSCLCHDIDHRGTNNSFQTSSKSVLAALYSSEGSVLERHHFAQTMCIMNTEGCNIFENLTAKHYQKALDLVRDIILATDLAHHFKILGNIQTMAKEGFDKTSEKNHKLLLCLLMTAADLSDQTKPWDKTKHIADLIYREFFSQGDMEKSLGKEPTEMMDRERARIPTLQISFLDNIALPVYKVLNDIFPQAESVRQVVEDNRRHWDKICALIQMKRGGSCEKMSYDQILALEEEELDNTDASPDIQQNGS